MAVDDRLGNKTGKVGVVTPAENSDNVVLQYEDRTEAAVKSSAVTQSNTPPTDADEDQEEPVPDNKNPRTKVAVVDVMGKDQIDMVKFTHTDDAESFYGQSCKEKNPPFKIQNDDYLTRVVAIHGDRLVGIQFGTLSGQESQSYGNQNGGAQAEFKAPPGFHIVGMTRAEDDRGCILDAHYEAIRPVVTDIDIKKGQKFLEQVKITFEDGAQELYGTTPSGAEMRSFKLGKNEFITKVHARQGEYFEGVQFFTTDGRASEHYGSTTTGRPVDFTAVNDIHIVGLVRNSGDGGKLMQVVYEDTIRAFATSAVAKGARSVAVSGVNRVKPGSAIVIGDEHNIVLVREDDRLKLKVPMKSAFPVGTGVRIFIRDRSRTCTTDFAERGKKAVGFADTGKMTPADNVQIGDEWHTIEKVAATCITLKDSLRSSWPLGSAVRWYPKADEAKRKEEEAARKVIEDRARKKAAELKRQQDQAEAKRKALERKRQARRNEEKMIRNAFKMKCSGGDCDGVTCLCSHCFEQNDKIFKKAQAAKSAREAAKAAGCGEKS